MAAFITQDAWNAGTAVKDETIHWEDLPQGVIFCIEFLERIPTKNQWETFVMHYSDIAGVQYKAFCPKRLLQLVRKHRKPSQRPFFVGRGVDKNNGFKYPNFELKFQQTAHDFDIFEEQ